MKFIELLIWRPEEENCNWEKLIRPRQIPSPWAGNERGAEATLSEKSESGLFHSQVGPWREWGFSS